MIRSKILFRILTTDEEFYDEFFNDLEDVFRKIKYQKDCHWLKYRMEKLKIKNQQ